LWRAAVSRSNLSPPPPGRHLRNEEPAKGSPDAGQGGGHDTAVIGQGSTPQERSIEMKTLKIRLTLLAVIAATTLVALLPGTAQASYVCWSDRTKKAGIVPVVW
jgi:hypothetical protein